MKPTAKLSRADRNALSFLYDYGVTNSCTCGDSDRPGAGTGYEGHDRGCWVHIHRRKLERIKRLIGETPGA